MGKVVLMNPPAPANDPRPHRPAILALVDDLAKLAAELYAAGRLDAGGVGAGERDDERKS